MDIFFIHPGLRVMSSGVKCSQKVMVKDRTGAATVALQRGIISLDS
jgi:hypothetical protein